MTVALSATMLCAIAAPVGWDTWAHLFTPSSQSTVAELWSPKWTLQQRSLSFLSSWRTDHSGNWFGTSLNPTVWSVLFLFSLGCGLQWYRESFSCSSWLLSGYFTWDKLWALVSQRKGYDRTCFTELSWRLNDIAHMKCAVLQLASYKRKGHTGWMHL